MITVHFKKLKRRTELSSEEERAIRSTVVETRRVPADEILIRSGEDLNSSMILVDG